MSERIYISYPARDGREVAGVVAALEAKGVQCWYADRDFPFNTWQPNIVSDTIKSAKALLLFFDDWANKSVWIEREVALAIEHGLPVIVLLADDPIELNDRLQLLLAGSRWARVRTLSEIDSALAAITSTPREGTEAL